MNESEEEALYSHHYTLIPVARITGVQENTEDKEFDHIIKRLNWSTYGVSNKYGTGSINQCTKKNKENINDIQAPTEPDYKPDELMGHLVGLGLEKDLAEVLLRNATEQSVSEIIKAAQAAKESSSNAKPPWDSHMDTKKKEK